MTDAPAGTSPPPGPLARALKVVAGVTAVLSLAFALRQAVVSVTEYRTRQRRVATLLATADVQRAGRDYRAAWGTLREAASVGARDDAAEGQGAVYTYLLGRLEEAAGDTARALATYRAALAHLPDGASGHRARRRGRRAAVATALTNAPTRRRLGRRTGRGSRAQAGG